MNTLLEQIKKKNAKAFTHSGKFHADDVFSYALLLYLNPAITITRGNKVPKDFDGIVLAKNLLQSSMSHSSSHLITTITPAKKMNLLH